MQVYLTFWRCRHINFVFQMYSLAKIRASSDGSISQDQFRYRDGVATEAIVEDPCTCGEKQKCPGHRRSILQIREPQNLYVPCREGCLMPADWMCRKLQSTRRDGK